MRIKPQIIRIYVDESFIGYAHSVSFDNEGMSLKIDGYTSLEKINNDYMITEISKENPNEWNI